MKNNNQHSTAPSNELRSSSVQVEAARIRAELESDTASGATPAIKPVIISCQVSTYRESDDERGSYAILLTVGETVVTTSVSLPFCSSVSLNIAASRAALALINVHLSLARAGEGITDEWWLATKDATNPETAVPGKKQVYRESFWISKIHLDGDPNFETTAWNSTYSLSCSAAFAKLAFHEID